MYSCIRESIYKCMCIVYIYICICAAIKQSSKQEYRTVQHRTTHQSKSKHSTAQHNQTCQSKTTYWISVHITIYIYIYVDTYTYICKPCVYKCMYIFTSHGTNCKADMRAWQVMHKAPSLQHAQYTQHQPAHPAPKKLARSTPPGTSSTFTTRKIPKQKSDSLCQ